MKNFKITTTSICYVEAETKEEAIEEFQNSIWDYGDAECYETVEEVRKFKATDETVEEVTDE